MTPNLKSIHKYRSYGLDKSTRIQEHALTHTPKCHCDNYVLLTHAGLTKLSNCSLVAQIFFGHDSHALVLEMCLNDEKPWPCNLCMVLNFTTLTKINGVLSKKKKMIGQFKPAFSPFSTMFFYTLMETIPYLNSINFVFHRIVTVTCVHMNFLFTCR